MKKTISKALQIGIPLVLGIALVIYFYAQFTPQQWAEMMGHFQSAKYGYLALAASLSVLSHVVRSHRWHLLLQPMGYNPRLINSFFAVCIAYFMNLFIPKSGELSRAVSINRYENVPLNKALGTIITERVIDLIFLIFFTVIAISLQYDVLFGYVREKIPMTKLLVGLVILVLLVWLGAQWLKKAQHRYAQKARDFMRGLKTGMLSIAHVQQPGLFIVESLVVWLLYLASFFTATFALEQTAVIGFDVLIIGFVVGSFTFAFTNSGVGYYPLAIAGILSLFGIPETLGNAFGWLVWTSNILSIILLGFVAFIGLPLVNKK